jgi:hypothetical protein
MTNAEYMKKSYYSRKAKLIDLLGGKCVVCGSTNDLQFDHKDPSTKVDTITNILSYKLETIYAELKKCQLLCVGCHTEKNKIDNGEAKHGTISMYRHHRCRCEPCRIAWNNATVIWKANAKHKKMMGSGQVGKAPSSERGNS